MRFDDKQAGIKESHSWGWGVVLVIEQVKTVSLSDIFMDFFEHYYFELN